MRGWLTARRSYGTLGRGIWRSRYNIDWRNYVNENRELADAEDLLRNHWSTNYFFRKSLAFDRMTLKPFLWLDRFVVNPGIQVARAAVTAVSDSTTRLGHLLSTDIHPAWFTRLPKQTFDYRILVDETKTHRTGTTARNGTATSDLPITGVMKPIEGALINSPRDIFHVLSRAKWRLNYSVQSLRRYGKARQFLAVYKELHPRKRQLSLPALVDFIDTAFLPYVLWQSNKCTGGSAMEGSSHADSGSQHWLKVHVAPHVHSLLTSLKTAPIELYGPGVVDDMTYDPKLQGIEYHGCFVKDLEILRHDGSVNLDYLKSQVYRKPEEGVPEDKYALDYSLLPSVILVGHVRTFSNNPPDSPVASGPKLLTMSFAISLLPDPHPNDKFPLYIQDATLLNAEQLQF